MVSQEEINMFKIYYMVVLINKYIDFYKLDLIFMGRGVNVVVS